MSTIFNNLFSINGVIDTGNSVLQNMNEIASACGTWITYDINQGKWAVVINQAGSPIVNFNDANIIGGISISSTSLTEVYNAVEIEFPHKDLRDQKDYIKLSIPTIDRYPNEPDNVLSIKTELINDPIQAELIAARELKQSRVDKVIQFRTDYTTLELSAGDLISVTNTVYGFSSKVFRIIKVDEEDADDGTIIFSITALEYSAGIYSTAGLVRVERTKNNGIASKSVNAAVQASDYAASTNAVTNSLLDPNNSALVASLLLALSKSIGSGGGSIVALDTFSVVASTSAVQTAFNAYQGGPISFPSNGSPAGNGTSKVILGFTLNSLVSNLILQIAVPLSTYSYQSASGTRTGVLAYTPTLYELYINGSLAQTNTADWQTPNVQIQIPNAPAGSYEIRVYPIATYDLDQATTYIINPYNFVVQAQASGGGITLTGYSYFK